MAIKLPSHVSKEIKKLVFAKADEYCYCSRSRNENGAFLDSLVSDPTIGGVLKQYISDDAVRTYIKDGVLNAYSKAVVRKKLNQVSFKSVIQDLYHVEVSEIGKIDQTSLFRSEENEFFLIHTGTYLKWETALRKLLECVATNDNITTDASAVRLCLLITVSNGEVTFSDRAQLRKALDYIGVKVSFAE